MDAIDHDRPAAVNNLARYAAAHSVGLYWAENAERGDEAAAWIGEILDDQGEAWDFLNREDADYAPAVRLYLFVHRLDRAANILRERQETVESFRQESAEFWQAIFGEQPDHWMLGGFATGVYHFASAPAAV